MKTNVVGQKTVCDYCGRSEDRLYHNSKVYFMTAIRDYHGLTGDFHFPLCADRKIEMEKTAEQTKAHNESVVGTCSYSECNKVLHGKDSFVYIDGVLYCSSLCKRNSDYLKLHGTKREDEMKATIDQQIENEQKKQLLNSLSAEQLQKLVELTK